MLVTLLLTLTVTTSSVFSLDDGSHYTNFWVVDFKPELSEKEINEIAQSYGFLSYGKLFEDLNLYEFHHPRVAKRSLNHAHEHTSTLENHVYIRSAEQQVGRTRKARDQIPPSAYLYTDPLWYSTWYLNRRRNFNLLADMNIVTAWNKGFTGKNVVVAMVDDGIEYDHPDLKKNYDPSASTDINDRDDDPAPRYDYSNANGHGTRCAGIVAAEANNTVCSVGIAYDAFIGGIRMMDGSVSDTVEARSLSFNSKHIDIYSCGWGPDDGGYTLEGPGPLVKKAFIDGVTKGRNGKGNIFVWAGGNGGTSDSCACDGYVNSIYTMSINSVSEHNQPTSYLEQCSSTLASAYSGDGEGQVFTTDIRKTCSTGHKGTSGSSSIASGLIAVMLEANPQMTWRDVQYVTIVAANPEPILSSGEFRINGAGRKYSHKFGYGLMDGGKMVELAQQWTEVPPQHTNHLPKMYPNIWFNTTYMYRGSIYVPKCVPETMDCIHYLEHVQLLLTMRSSKRGDLSVILRSPLGTESTILTTRRRDYTMTGFENWPFMSVHFWGEDPSGFWEFEIANQGYSGSLTAYQLVIYGVSTDPFDLYRTKVQDLPSWTEFGSVNKINGNNSNPMRLGVSMGLILLVLMIVLITGFASRYYKAKRAGYQEKPKSTISFINVK